jgi:hypothetical protein
MRIVSRVKVEYHLSDKDVAGQRFQHQLGPRAHNYDPKS